MYKVDHVFAHWRSDYSVDEATIFKMRIFRLQKKRGESFVTGGETTFKLGCATYFDFLDDLFPKGTHFSRARYSHVFTGLVSVKQKKNYI